MGVVQTLLRVKRLIAQGVGVVVALFGLLLVSASFVPQDAETAVVFAIGLFVILVGIGMVTNPEKVRFGRQRRHNRDDDDDQNRRWDRSRNRNRRGR